MIFDLQSILDPKNGQVKRDVNSEDSCNINRSWKIRRAKERDQASLEDAEIKTGSAKTSRNCTRATVLQLRTPTWNPAVGS